MQSLKRCAVQKPWVKDQPSQPIARNFQSGNSGEGSLEVDCNHIHGLPDDIGRRRA